MATNDQPNGVWHMFKDNIVWLLKQHDYDVCDIEFINLNDDFWMSPNKFFTCDTTPSIICEELRYIGWARSWNVPDGFRITMKDRAVFVYNECMDEYYSNWVYVQNVGISTKEYIP